MKRKLTACDIEVLISRIIAIMVLLILNLSIGNVVASSIILFMQVGLAVAIIFQADIKFLNKMIDKFN